jgi:hypothetical protein
MNRISTNKAATLDEGYMVPKAAMLENFSSCVGAAEWVQLSDLTAMTRIRLQTTNSQYEITILDPATARVSVQGGQFLRTPTEATLWGASLGSAFLRSGLIAIGFQLELSIETKEGPVRQLTTSPVDHLFIEKPSLPQTAGISSPGVDEIESV